MKQILLSGVALAAMLTSASAADIPAYAPPEAAVVAEAGWTGFYVGSYAGWIGADGNGEVGGIGDFDLEGATIGSQAGYNWQSGNFVYGVEADLGFTTAHAGKDEEPGLDDMERAGVDWTGSVRGRAGYAFGNYLLYATAGVAGAELEFDDNSEIDENVLFGWTVGAGIEAKFAPNLSVRLEYLYSDLGSESFTIDGEDVEASLQSHQVRVGLNYFFGPSLFDRSYELAAPGEAWSGLYAGGHAGYAFGNFEQDAIDIDGSADVDGGLRGIQAGYNWQSGNWVLGLETDIALSRAEATEEEDGIDDLDLERVRLDYVGTVRGRVGFAAGRFLVFGTGGFAYGGLELYDDADSQKTTQIGWTAGGGVEFKLTDQASVKLDYLFVDLGDETLTVDDDERNVEFDAHLVRAGANYRF